MAALPDMAGGPFCPEAGLWNTAWCLVATTGALLRDCTAFATEQMMPQAAHAALESIGDMFLLLPPISASRGRIEVAGTMLWKAVSESFSRAAPALSKRIASEVEVQRAAFINRFPQYAHLLPAGELVNLVGTVAWLAISLVLVWRLVKGFWGQRRQAPEVLFFPDRSGRHVARLCSEIRAARRRIWLAMYMITDDDLCEVLLHAHQRGVDVRVIVDDEYAETYGAQARLLNGGVPLATDKSWARMHHKFMVLDRKVFSGSFNWTRQASRANCENLCLLVDPAIVQAYASEFARLWEEFNGAGRARYECAAATAPVPGSSGRRRDRTPPPRRGAMNAHTRTPGELRVPPGFGGS